MDKQSLQSMLSTSFLSVVSNTSMTFSKLFSLMIITSLSIHIISVGCISSKEIVMIKKQ